MDRDIGFERDAGISLVEILVAMLLLAVVLVGFVPLLITGIRTSVSNTTTATAVQLVSQQLDLARSKSPDCSAVVALDSHGDFTDARGVPITVTTTVTGTCPVTEAQTFAVSVSATIAAPDPVDPAATIADEIAAASAFVLVTPGVSP